MLTAQTQIHSLQLVCLFIRFSGNFDLIDDAASANPVAARIENDEKVLWSSQPGDREGVFELHLMEDLSSTSGERLHRFCLENGKHFPQEDSLDRTIGWAIRVRPVPRALDEDHAGPDSERALQLAEWASELQEEWMILLDHYNFLKTREGLYGELSDHLLGRVMRWTLFEAVVLVIIATGQVLYFRKFMERRRYL